MVSRDQELGKLRALLDPKFSVVYLNNVDGTPRLSTGRFLYEVRSPDRLRTANFTADQLDQLLLRAADEALDLEGLLFPEELVE